MKSRLWRKTVLHLETQTTQSTTLSLDGLWTDTSYTLTLTALQGENRSDSAELTFKTAPAEVGAVEGISAAMSESNPLEYTIAWQPYVSQETNADGSAPKVTYALYESAKPEVGYQLVAENLEDTSRTLTGTKELFQRYYKVCPVLTVDGKKFSGSLCDQPVQVTTGLVNNLTVTAAATSSHSILDVSWTPYDTSKLDSNLENPVVHLYRLRRLYRRRGIRTTGFRLDRNFLGRKRTVGKYDPVL